MWIIFFFNSIIHTIIYVIVKSENKFDITQDELELSLLTSS